MSCLYINWDFDKSDKLDRFYNCLDASLQTFPTHSSNLQYVRLWKRVAIAVNVLMWKSFVNYHLSLMNSNKTGNLYFSKFFSRFWTIYISKRISYLFFFITNTTIHSMWSHACFHSKNSLLFFKDSSEIISPGS